MTNSTLSKLCILTGCAAFIFCSVPRSIPEKSGSSDPKIIAVEEHRIKTHSEFLSEKSPLPKEEKKKFKGLNYYPIDLNYIVTGKLVRTATPVLFKMKTTTTRLPDYMKYADVSFTLNGKEFSLEVYQSPDLMKKPGYADYLFVPFTDETNGDETYEVGRYLELRIPEGDTIELDFNKCYNPYCSYSGNYSCPIPPAANHLATAVKAGEKKYKNVSGRSGGH
jgi:uncharacterized protein (DUF1684 family)